MEPQPTPSYRTAATNGLAVVGFIALISVGVWSAVYSTRLVPGSVSSAAVYLGSLFNPAQSETPQIAAVPNATSTIISFGTAIATTTATSTKPVASPTPKQNPATITVPITVAPQTPHGLSDLIVQASVVGYLTTNSTDSFVASTTVPSGARPAVKFTVKNIGTNYSGTWSFTASIPTRSSYTYNSDVQRSLGPDDRIEYVLGFDQAVSGSQQPLVITINNGRTALETNYSNNRVEFKLNVQ